MEQVRILPINTNQFEANGRTYTFEENLSIERYRMFERFRIEVGLGASTADLVDVIKQTIDYIERGFQGEKVIAPMLALNYNALKGVTDMAAKEPFAVWMCTLFFNTPDEDRRWFKEDVMRSKITDWQEAGIDNGFFINRACAMIAGFSNIYEDIIQRSSDWEQALNLEERGTPGHDSPVADEEPISDPT